MTSQTIGTSIFSEHTHRMYCGVVPGRHAPASVERLRTDNFGVDYFCKPHAVRAKKVAFASARKDAQQKRIQAAR